MRIEASNRLTIPLIAFVASVAATSLAAAQDLGDKWQSLTAAEWRIIFSAPGLDGLIERHQLSKNVDSSYDHEVAFWSGSTSPYPNAVIHYLKTHSDTAWMSTPDPRTIGEEGLFQEKTIKFDSLKKGRNRLGRVQWRLFHFDNVNCVGFSEAWGNVDQRLAGDRMIVGYYCAEPGQPLPDELARKVIAAIDIDDNKDPRRQFLGESLGPFDGFWTGSGHRESGSCKVSASPWGRIESVQVELVIREMEISGRVTRARHSATSVLSFSVDASFRGTVSENGEFDLQVGKTNLGAELVLRGRLPQEGNRARGEWDTPNCHGKLSLIRKYPY